MKIGIVGLGLIGGSLAMASAAAGHEVVGTDEDDATAINALASKAISRPMDVKDMAHECDIVVLCVPSRTAALLVEEALSGTAIVTDVASVKQPICESVAKLEPEVQDRFIGGHPMAGSEQSGFDAARVNLFKNKMWIVVPPHNNSLKHVAVVESFISSLGVEHCVLSPEQHDRLVAYISHLPQLASSALMDLAAGEAIDNEIILRLAGGGFRDMTRIAANNTTMWLDIVHDNASEISAALDAYIDALQTLKKNVDSFESKEVEDLFTGARSARSSLPDAGRRLERLTEVLIPVPDTPGVLASITALTKDINVYDIKIVHALEEDRGVLSLVVQPDDADGLVATLNENGFEALRSDLE
ncbi:MAG TPA: prephenate dehydrogenase/arogenate dehydrogenase family protein [Acidimicrobiia bacterium]|nr:prephenate dehydrogenase/arogenate dehydrogenase family protein [Acidimicrobiia bacterium]